MIDHPFVSILIPVYNNAAGLERTLLAVQQQNYPQERFEVIVIDNGSSDQPTDVATKFNATYLVENSYLNSPYSARNRGLEIAKGDIIVLLDTTCAPAKEWLAEGIDCLQNQGADLVGGDVRFALTIDSTIGEVYDSLTNIRMKETITKRQAAKTTNLFIKRSVFDIVGNFPEGLRSGGDVRWTKNATLAGLNLVFCEKAYAVMLPRKLRPLIRKQYRVGKGQPKVWKNEGTLPTNIIKKVLLCWVPPNPFFLKKRIKESGYPFIAKRFLSIFLVGYLLRFVTAAGNISGLIGNKT